MNAACQRLPLFLFLSFLACAGAAEEEPLATFAVVSNPYITTLPPKEIVDENGRLRDFLAKSTKIGIANTVKLVNEMQPDALIVLGSLTWSGSEADFDLFEASLDQIQVPKLLVPGSRDVLAEESAAWREKLGDLDATDSVREIAGVRLIFSSDMHADPASASQRMETQLTGAGDAAQATLLFSAHPSVGRTKRTPTQEEFWQLVEKHNIAAEFESTRYGANVGLTNTLPRWTVGSIGWSTRGAVTRVRVFRDRVEIAQVAALDRPVFSLAVPNPANAPRFGKIEDDPYGCLSYSAELAKNPDFTVGLISDPQFDRESNRQTLISKAEAGIAELNRLNPDLVIITGDLVNNNLPEEWELFNSIFAELKPRRIDVPGNHDVLFNYDFVEASYSSAPQKKPEYAEIVKKALAEAEKEGFTGPTALFEKYTGSPPRQRIDFKDAAFITVPFLTMRADPDQVAYLREQLAGCADKRHVFVAAHYPALPLFGNNVLPDRGGREVLKLLEEHNVAGFLFGHRHRNGFAMFDKTAHVLTDNMSTIQLLHVHQDRIVIGRKRIGTALYPTLTVPTPRAPGKD